MIPIKQRAEEAVPSNFEGPNSRTRIVALIERALEKQAQTYDRQICLLQQDLEASQHQRRIAQEVIDQQQHRAETAEADRDAAVAETIHACMAACKRLTDSYRRRGARGSGQVLGLYEGTASECVDAIHALSPCSDLVCVPREPTMGQWDDFCTVFEVPFDKFIKAYKAITKGVK